MGLWRSLTAFLAGRGNGGQWDVQYVGPSVPEVMGMGPEALYRTQPHLRTVISFLARNIAQLPLHMYERVSDTDRRRVTSGPAAELLGSPNPDQTQYELLFQTVADLKLNGYALWALGHYAEEGRWEVRAIPPSWVLRTGGGTPFAPAWVEFQRGRQRVVLENKPGQHRQFLEFVGYTPGEPSKGSSPVEALKQILAEQIQAWSYRQQVWQRGGRVGAYLTRPVGAPVWSREAREKFSRDWNAKWTGPDGPKAGGTPILEEGMALNRVAFNAREEEWSEVAKLSLATVAAVYHTSPTMVGILDNANYSNVREFSRMLYTDTLGPDLAMLEQRINTYLLPMVDERPGLYAEFNLQAKLAGSFEEQAAVMSTSVGRPWLSADEARARFNLPAIGGDAAHLVTPLNVLVGGQASPRDSGSQNRSAATPPGALKMLAELAETAPDLVLAILKGKRSEPLVPALALARADGSAPLKLKTAGRDEDAKAIEQVLRRFFERQARSVLSALNAKGPDWWDGDRWDRELTADLLALALTVSAEVGADVLRELGFDADQFDSDRIRKFLAAVAASRAQLLNAKTLEQLNAALDGDISDDAEKSTPEGVFEEAVGSRSEQVGVTLATTLAGLAAVEAMKQIGRPGVTKTWLTTSSNPRPAHAQMHGETVGLGEKYSNGMDWPGDLVGAGGDAGEIANCSCISELTIP